MPETLATPIPGNGVVHPDPVIAHPVGAYHVLRLLPSDPYTRKLFPAYVERCIGFIDRMGCETDPIWLGQLLYSNFHQATNYIHCLAAFDDNEKIIAHSFAYVEAFQKLGNHVHILQIEKDKDAAHDNFDILPLGLTLIKEWGKSMNLTKMVYSSETLSRLKLYEKYGFKLFRVMGIGEIS